MEIFVKFSTSRVKDNAHLPKYCLRWLGRLTLATRELIGQAEELCRQVKNKHSLARDAENRKSNRCPCPANTLAVKLFFY